MRTQVAESAHLPGRVVVLVIALLLLAVACTPGEESDAVEETGDRLRVVTTVSPITSLVENIGGTRIRLEGIVPEGVNSHTFEPSPSTAAILSEADLFVANGLFSGRALHRDGPRQRQGRRSHADPGRQSDQHRPVGV